MSGAVPLAWAPDPGRQVASAVKPKLPEMRKVRADVSDLVDTFNLRGVWHWFGLAGLVGTVAGLGAVVFQWLVESGTHFFWTHLIGYTPPLPPGETLGFAAALGPPSILALLAVPAFGGLVVALLVRFAPEAEGGGTDGAIHAYHRRRGHIPARVPLVKLLASSVTLSTGGSAGREGPISQIGAGVGSVLGGLMNLSDRERRILVAAGMSAGVGAIFRAPLAGALFAAEVLYSGPEIEAEVIIPALISSIISYVIYCSVYGFGHLFGGTEAFAFSSALELGPYFVLGLAMALGSILYVRTFSVVAAFWRALKISPYVRPVLGGLAVGAIGVAAWLLTGDLSSLAVMGSGYGVLGEAVQASGAAAPAIGILLLVAFGKMLTTGITIGSGGSGGVFGPAMVIGGCLGAAVGTLFHQWIPDVVPHVGAFTIVGMAGFFAGAANTPISTLIMVADMTGTYSLLLPSMLVVSMCLFIAHRWTIYPEQVPSRIDSPAHRGEFMVDVLEDMRVDGVFNRGREVHTVFPETSLRQILDLITHTQQHYFPIVDHGGRMTGVFSLNDLREVLYDQELADLIVAQDLSPERVLFVTPEDTLHRALGLVTMKNIDEIPVVDSDAGRHLLGMLSRRDIIASYHQKVGALAREAAAQ